MRTRLLLALLLLPAVAADARDRLPGPLGADVIEVIDGDTLAVRIQLWLGQDLTTTVRLNGIDTPEKRSRCAEERRLAGEARQRLAGLVKGGRVVLRDVTNDKYGGRVRARVAADDGTDLAAALIEAGVARPYKGRARQPWCE